MYDENSMKSHIFWIKFKRVFLLILFTVIGTSLGVIISDYIVNILLFPAFLRIIIVAVSAVLFLAFALLITANTGKEVQDSYWKIAVYKKLVVISKKLDNLDSSDKPKVIKKENIQTTNQTENSKEPISKITNEENNETNNYVDDLEKDLKDLSKTLSEN